MNIHRHILINTESFHSSAGLEFIFTYVDLLNMSVESVFSVLFMRLFSVGFFYSSIKEDCMKPAKPISSSTKEELVNIWRRLESGGRFRNVVCMLVWWLTPLPNCKRLPSLIPGCGCSMWRLNVLAMYVWILARYSCFLPLPKNIHLSLVVIDDYLSSLSLCMAL